MEIEYEATFTNIDKSEMRARLKKVGAKLMRPEFPQKRVNFHLSKEKRSKDAWLRVRGEEENTTPSLKVVDGSNIDNQKEICLHVDSFDNAVKLLTAIGCEKKAYQETKRELWQLDGVEISIDEWPFLEPFVEVEGRSEKEVQEVSKKIGFDYGDALFCAVGALYKRKYGIAPDEINSTEKIVFDMKNPFLKK